MSDISSEDWIILTMQGKLEEPTLKILRIQLDDFRGKDVKEDLDKVKKEIDKLFEQLKKDESSDSVGEG